MLRRLSFAGLCAAGAIGIALGSAAVARADVLQDFDLAWSGAPNGNNATATGVITIDETLIDNPGDDVNFTVIPSFVTALTLTITGANAGNGTFTLADFTGLYWDTAGATLDLTQQLVGQPTGGDPWGTPGGGGGDFNLFSEEPGAPNGDFFFELGTDNDDGGDVLQLTSFAPASSPEPASLALLGAGLAATSLARRRKKA